MTNNPVPNTRILKVSETGDFYRKHTWPYLRLMGLWLLRAGIHPNSHVCIGNPQPGVLVIQTQDEATKTFAWTSTVYQYLTNEITTNKELT